MKIKWKALGKLGLAIVGAVLPAVDEVERSVVALKAAHTGPEKQAAALDLVKSSVMATEQALDKDVLNDPEVEQATKSVIDAIVALQNVIVKKQQPAPAGS